MTHILLSAEFSSDPLQCSCLENPRDGGAWWAAVYGVAQSRTGLKRLSSSSSRTLKSSKVQREDEKGKDSFLFSKGMFVWKAKS